MSRGDCIGCDEPLVNGQGLCQACASQREHYLYDCGYTEGASAILGIIALGDWARRRTEAGRWDYIDSRLNELSRKAVGLMELKAPKPSCDATNCYCEEPGPSYSCGYWMYHCPRL